MSSKRKGALTRTKTRTKAADESALPLFASAMRQARARVDVEVDGDEARPDFVSSGLSTVDRELRGGFKVGAMALVAARPKVGATSLLMGTVLAALERGERVAYFSERLREDQLRGRIVVLESRVNGYRFRAGFVSAEDRIAIAAARERIPWGNLSLVTQRTIVPDQIEAHLFSYRPLLVVADVHPRAEGPAATGGRREVEEVLAGLEQLADIAGRHRVALVVRGLLARGNHPPDVLELPGVGAAARYFEQILFIHRHVSEEHEEESSAPDGLAEARIAQVRGNQVEPRIVPLRFDQRFAGLLER